MNIKRLILAVVVVFIGVAASDFLIHQVWLKEAYAATKSLWRPEQEMSGHIQWIFAAEFLSAAMFVLIWSKGFPATASLAGTCLYGICMGLFSQTMTLVLYAVQPFPADLAIKWFVAGVAQGALMGLLAHLVGRSKRPAGQP